jgi:hypothetical protein
MEIVGIIATEIDELHPDRVFIDGTGLGCGVVDRLRERGYRECVLINFGSKAQDERKYANRRAEMWGRMAEWFADEGGADIRRRLVAIAHLRAWGFIQQQQRSR